MSNFIKFFLIWYSQQMAIPCCEPCDDGMWKKCNTDNCIYGSISDCELADQDGESNLESLSLSDIWGTE